MSANGSFEKQGNVPITDSRSRDALMREDELDLIDIGLFFWDRKKLFLAAFVLVAVGGLIVFKVLFAPQQVTHVRSQILLDSQVMTHAVMPALAPNVIANRIRHVNLIEISRLPEFDSIKAAVIATVIVPVPGTYVLEFSNQVMSDDAAVFEQFHHALMNRVYADLSNSSLSISGNIGGTLHLLGNRVTSLQQLINTLDAEIKRGTEINTSEADAGSLSSSVEMFRTASSNQLDEMSIHLDSLKSSLRRRTIHP